MPFAVAVTLAVPAAPVTTVVADKAALAPEAGALNVTVTPLSGLLPASFRVTVRGAANCAPTMALCGVPVGVIDDGGPAVLVSEKIAVAAPSPPTPPTLAVTV